MLLATTNEVAQISRFGLVGVFNTVLDFAIFNALSSQAIGLNKVLANTVSTTIAMIFSFFVNRSYVFGEHSGGLNQVLLFIIVTAFGLYVIQNGIIYFLTIRWSWPRRLVAWFTRSERIALDPDFVLKNAAKMIGTAVSLVWNFILYGRIVFRVNS